VLAALKLEHRLLERDFGLVVVANLVAVVTIDEEVVIADNLAPMVDHS